MVTKEVNLQQDANGRPELSHPMRAVGSVGLSGAMPTRPELKSPPRNDIGVGQQLYNRVRISARNPSRRIQREARAQFPTLSCTHRVGTQRTPTSLAADAADRSIERRPSEVTRRRTSMGHDGDLSCTVERQSCSDTGLETRPPDAACGASAENREDDGRVSMQAEEASHSYSTEEQRTYATLMRAAAALAATLETRQPRRSAVQHSGDARPATPTPMRCSSRCVASRQQARTVL